ncbi:MAG: hypothetical protein HY909_13725 [Deltaproteobacteria bacterium]|nr:hypothetical protein [Deltaproteobacteria bacterium]
MRRASLVTVLLPLVLWLAPTGALGTTTERVTVEALTRRSEDVVLAVARRSHARWDGRVIVTDTELEVTSVLRGRLIPRSAILVTTPGGVVGRIGQVVPGAPVFTDGGAYVLFLQPGAGTLRYLSHLTAAAVSVSVGPGGVLASVPGDLTLPAEAAPPGPSQGGAPGVVTGAHRAAVTVPLERLVRAIQGAGP